MDYEDKDETEIDEPEFMRKVREKYSHAVDVARENYDAALDDIKFAMLSEQWTDEERENRRKEGRPCLTINKLVANIHQVVNDSRQNKPSIRCLPVDDNADVKTAEVLSGLIRNIEVSSNADVAYDTAIQQGVSGGFGYFRINVEFADDDTFDRDILIERITNQFSVVPDPDSTSADGSDWTCCFVTDRIKESEFKEKYPKAECDDWPVDEDSDTEWKNEDGIWITEYWKREKVPKSICLLSDGDVVDEEVYQENLEMYTALQIQKVESRVTMSHKVTQYILSGNEILETNEWAGKYIPIVPVYGEEINVENKRVLKSLIRDAKDAQKNFNFWRTTATEVVGSSPKTPFIGEESAFEVDTEKWLTANVKNHAFLRHKKGTMPPQRQPFASVPAGVLQEAMNSADDIKATMGMFGASIGEEDNAVSGRAIIARQRESDTGTFHFIDNLSRAMRHAGRIIVDLIPHVYQPGRIIRILGEDKREASNVQLGQLGQQGQMPDFTNVFDLTAGKYDVVVDVGPGYTTKRQEAASQMIEFARVNPAAAGLISDLIAKNLDWPGSQEIAERFKAMLPPQIIGENPQIQQLQQALQQTQAQAQQIIGQLQQEVERVKQDKRIEVEKLKIDAYDKETNRLKTVQTGMMPEQVQALVIQTLQQLLETPDITPDGPASQQMAMQQQQQIQMAQHAQQEQAMQQQALAQQQQDAQQQVPPATAQPEGVQQ